MEIRVNKEIKDYHESLFMGLSTRQFICSLGAVGAAVGIYFGLSDVLDKETISWVCIICAAPLAAAGFFKYNGLNFEQFLIAFYIVNLSVPVFVHINVKIICMMHIRRY